VALILKDRISETTTTTGTGTLTLGGALSGFQPFSSIGNTNTTYYCITDTTAWEVGLGTYSSSGNTLARTTVLSNSNGNTTPITLAVGTKTVFSVYPAERAIVVDGATIQIPNSAVLPLANGGTGSSTAAFSGSNITDLNATAITAGTISNSRTTASSSNGASSIVERDATGNFSTNVITANEFAGSGANLTSLNASSVSSGTLAVARGGTGAATLDANNVILGNGTSAVQFVAPGTASNVLTSNGSTWVSQAGGGGGGGTPTVNEYNTPVTGATWTKPASANWVLIEIWGGGGSGGRAANNEAGGGGGGGAYNSALVKFSDLVGAVTYTVASGGASRTSSGVGNAGGTSQVDMASFQGGSTKQLFSYGGGGGGGGAQSGGGGGGGGQMSVGQVGGIQSQSGRGNLYGWGGSGGNPGRGAGAYEQTVTACQYAFVLAMNGSSGGGGGGAGIDSTPTAYNTNYMQQGAGSIYGGGGGGGGGGQTSSIATISNGGSSLYGGGGGGGANRDSFAGGNGGTSVWGGAGSAGTTSTTASAAGTQPGGGSGGTETGNSGQGGDGRVRFTYW
jgi:hypothetical protein